MSRRLRVHSSMSRPIRVNAVLSRASILLPCYFLFCLFVGEGGGAHVRAVFLPLSPIASTLVCLVDLSVKSFVYIYFFQFWIILCY